MITHENHSNLREILFDWRRWEPEEVKNFINTLISSNEGIIKFLTSFTIKTSKYTITDKVAKSSWTFDFENSSMFVNLDEIESKVRDIASSSYVEQLNVRNKVAIKLFLEKK